MAGKSTAVVFATTNFSDVSNGPGVFAQYLWQTFVDDPLIDFHLVAPQFPSGLEHPRLHVAGTGRVPGAIYRRVQAHAADVAGSLQPERVILHRNISHFPSLQMARPVRLWGQINDYEAANAIRDFPDHLREAGPRRAGALLRRHHLERKAVRKQQLTLCNSQFVRSEVLARYRPHDANRVAVVYKGVDLTFFHGRRPATSTDNMRVTFFGTNLAAKGFDVLLHALALTSVPIELNVVGAAPEEIAKSGDALDRARKAVRSIDTHGRLDRERVRAILGRTDVLVAPSRREGFGVAVLEALAMGCFVIASDVGGVPEILEGTQCGALAPAGDAETLAHALDRAWRDKPYFAPGFSESARKVACRFSTDRMLETIRALYLEEWNQ